MRVMSVFSGISAETVAFRPLGWEMIAYAEPAVHQSHVLAARCGAGRPRYLPPNAKAWQFDQIPVAGIPNFGDIRQIRDDDLRALGQVDLLIGGSPCPSFSTAGLRRGLEDDRGDLTLVYADLIVRMRRINQLKFAVWENVHGALRHTQNPFGYLVGAVVGEPLPIEPPRTGWTNAGYVSGLRARVAWRVLDSANFGVPQRRKRVFALIGLDPRDRVDPATVLLELDGEGRSDRPRDEARQDHPRGAAAGARGLIPVWPIQNGGNIGNQAADGIGGPTDPMYTLVSEAKAHAVVYPEILGTLMTNTGGSRHIDIEHIPVHDIGGRYVARRILPVEAERLQGLPDGWSDVLVRGRPATDTERYRAVGNAMTTTVVHWIGRRLQAAVDASHEALSAEKGRNLTHARPGGIFRTMDGGMASCMHEGISLGKVEQAMTKVLTFQAGKGGTGKSTLACHVAGFLARSGESVLLIDADPQGSLADWAKVRGDHQHHIEVRQYTLTQLPDIVGKVRSAEAADWIVIDTPPHTQAVAAAAMRVADLVVMPIRPNRFDIQAMRLTHELAKNAGISESKVAVVINQCSTHYAAKAGAQKAADVVKKLYGWSSIGYVGQRVSVGYACDSGLDVGELSPTDPGAREIDLIVRRVRKAVGMPERVA